MVPLSTLNLWQKSSKLQSNSNRDVSKEGIECGMRLGVFLEQKSVCLRRLSRGSRRKQEGQPWVGFEGGWTSSVR